MSDNWIEAAATRAMKKMAGVPCGPTEVCRDGKPTGEYLIPTYHISQILRQFGSDEQAHYEEERASSEDTVGHIYLSLRAVRAWLDTLPEAMPVIAIEVPRQREGARS
jgi:hypothetical protein